MTEETITWTPITITLDALDFWERNPKRMSKAQARRLEASTDRLGRAGVLLVGPADASGRVPLYDGHQRANVWRTLYGMNLEVHALQSNRPLTEDERLSVSLLTVTATGSLDFDALAAWDAGLLQDLGLGADYKAELDDAAANIAAMLEALTAEQTPVDAEPQLDRAEELREQWGVEQGQLWQLGEHRLICGDCTDRAVVERVMAGEKAQLMITDPPYGIDYHGNFIQSGKILADDERIWQGGIENDEDGFVITIENAFSLATDYLSPGAVCMVCAPAGRKLKDFMNLWPDNWHFQAALVWNKQSLIISRWDYHPQHEMILYGWVGGAGHSWYGGTKQSTVWDIPRHQGSGYKHPTEKPLQLYERGIENHSKTGDIAFEPFSGSGTAIIACENLNRRCRAIEISPTYVAVTLQRYQDATGKTPTRLG